MKDSGGLGEDIDLEIFEIPVEYNTVDNEVPKIWKTHKPKVSLRPMRA